ncbi:MAG: cytidine deaminase [Puniceicoccaceae bacterium]|nr:MAG: cytidine deaminase [Puniceicoccaceae bacterium]
MLTNQKIKAALVELEESEKIQLISEVKDPDFSGQINSVGVERAEKLLKLATCFSVAPISCFYVGAIAVGKSGKLYLGANMEFQGVPLSASLHAEQSAILNAWMHEEREVVALHVSETPCGHCRQFMRELSNLSNLKIHCKGQTFQIEDLLPGAFGENRKKGHGLLDSTITNLESVKTNPHTRSQVAINAAQRSYAPYSQSPEGFVAQCLDGHFFSGRVAESIAFNPSVSGVVVALNQRNLSSSRSVAITACTQAKLATALSSPLAQAKAIIKHISEASVDEVQMEVRSS